MLKLKKFTTTKSFNQGISNYNKGYTKAIAKIYSINERTGFITYKITRLVKLQGQYNNVLNITKTSQIIITKTYSNKTNKGGVLYVLKQYLGEDLINKCILVDLAINDSEFTIQNTQLNKFNIQQLKNVNSHNMYGKNQYSAVEKGLNIPEDIENKGNRNSTKYPLDETDQKINNCETLSCQQKQSVSINDCGIYTYEKKNDSRASHAASHTAQDAAQDGLHIQLRMGLKPPEAIENKEDTIPIEYIEYQNIQNIQNIQKETEAENTIINQNKNKEGKNMKLENYQIVLQQTFNFLNTAAADISNLLPIYNIERTQNILNTVLDNSWNDVSLFSKLEYLILFYRIFFEQNIDITNVYKQLQYVIQQLVNDTNSTYSNSTLKEAFCNSATKEYKNDYLLLCLFKKERIAA